MSEAEEVLAHLAAERERIVGCSEKTEAEIISDLRRLQAEKMWDGVTDTDRAKQATNLAEHLMENIDLSEQPHYTAYDIEPIDVIRAMGDLPAFCRGNIIKYVMRYQFKGGVEDLKKAQTYLDWLVDEVEGNAEHGD